MAITLDAETIHSLKLGDIAPLESIQPSAENVDVVRVPVISCCIEPELYPRWRSYLAAWLRRQRELLRRGTIKEIGDYPRWWYRVFERVDNGWIRTQ